MAKARIARKLHFDTLDDLLAEAKRIAAHPEAPTRGRWDAAQNVWHVGRYIQASVEGYPFKAAWWMRLLGPMLKKRMIRRPMQPGFNTPKNVSDQMEPGGSAAGEITMAQACAQLEHWVEQAKDHGFIPVNPVFGRMSRDEWVALHCRHAEMHFGLIELPTD